MTTFLRHRLWPAIALLVALTVITGVVYPARRHGRRPGRVPPPGQRLVRRHRRRPDRRLEPDRPGVHEPKYFWGRPSAAGTRTATTRSGSAGSNLGPTNQDAHRPDRRAEVDALRAANGDEPIPVDLVTTSASGLDPDISPAAAEYQVARVARPAGCPRPTSGRRSPATRSSRCSASSASRASTSSMLNLDLDGLPAR